MVEDQLTEKVAHQLVEHLNEDLTNALSVARIITSGLLVGEMIARLKDCRNILQSGGYLFYEEVDALLKRIDSAGGGGN